MNLQTLKVVITADASGFNKTIKNVKSQLSGLNNTVENATSGITQSLQSISKKVSFAAITAGLATLSRSAIRAASDLQEVQNVVDNAFGKADEDIEKFAKNAIYQFGISEYAAKNFSSTLMAMGRSMGIATDKSKTMSIQLTGLASDLASFYNTDVETAFNALQSIYTGTVRPLRQYGVALSEAALQEYANAKGINKKVSAMNAAEKATLRYNYVLEKTALAQGDFARTNMSWHNSLQTISNQLNNLAVVVGTILMNVFEPLVAMLSTIVSYAVKAAQALAAMFGINLQFSSNTNGIADAWDDATEATEDATGAAKKYKKLIDGFDELNIMTSTNGGSGASGFGSGGFDVGNYFDITEGQEKLIDFNKWLADIDEWLVKAEETFEELGIKLGIKFNSLVHYLDWALIGKTIIDGLNNIFITINRYFDKANFINFGYMIATMVNSALETIKPEEWGQILVNKINSAFQTLYGFVSILDWKLLANRIQEIIRAALEKLDINSISGAIIGFLSGVSTVIKEWADTFPIQEIANKVWTIIDNVIKGVDWKSLGEGLNKLITQLFKAIQNIDYSEITSAISQLLEGLDIIGLWIEYMKTKVDLIFEGLKGILTTPQGWKLIGVAVAGSIVSMLTNAFSSGIALLKTFFTATLLKVYFTSGLSGVAQYLSRALGLVKGFLTMVGAEVKYGFMALNSFIIKCIQSPLAIVKQFLSKTLGLIEGFLSIIKSSFTAVISFIKTPFAGLISFISGVIIAVKNFVAQWNEGFSWAKAALTAFGVALTAVGAIILGAPAVATGVIALIVAAVGELVIYIHEHWDGICAWFGEVKDKLFEIGGNLIHGLMDGISSVMSGIWDFLNSYVFTPFIDGFKSLFGIHSPSTVMAEMGGFIVEGLFQGISLSEFWGSIQTWFNDKLTNMKQWCSDTWASISTTATEKWNSIKETVGTSVSKIGETISTWGQGASDNFNTIMSNIGSVIGDALGIDTTNWGDGLNEMLGLSGDFGKGIVDYFGDIGKSIANNLTNGANGGITALNGLVSAYKKAKAEDYASQLSAYNAQVASLKAAGVKVIPSFSPRAFPKISLPSLFSFIPRLASGGVITSETMAVMGEYPGARSNPEIVSPQNILRETIDASNGEMVNAFAQMTRQIITAIDGVDMNVSIGDDVIANSASRGDKAYRKRTGKSLFAY